MKLRAFLRANAAKLAARVLGNHLRRRRVVVIRYNRKPAAALNVAFALADCLFVTEKDFYVLLAYAVLCRKNVRALNGRRAIDVDIVLFKQIHIQRNLARCAVFYRKHAVINVAAFHRLKHLCEARKKAH